MKKVSGYWSSKTNCRNVTKRCKSKSELYKRFPSAYSSSLKNGWIDEFFPQSSSKRGKIFWTKENCREEAKKYKTRSEFSFKCNRAYRVSLDNGWLEEFGFPPKHNYTKEECAKMASECKNRNDFESMYPSAYRVSVENGWLTEFFGKKNITFTKMFNNIKKRYTSPTNFKENAPAQYRYAKQHGWLGELFPDSKAKDCQITWTYDTCKEESKKYSSRHEFKENNKTAYFMAAYYGWLNDFYPVVKKPKTKKIWTKEECAEIAAQCNGRREFCKKKASAYRYAQQQGWLDEFFGIKNKTTKEKCRKSAEYYKKSSLLKKYAPEVYKKCLFSGWLEEFFPNEMNTVTANEKTIRHRILDFVEANGPQTKNDLYRIMLTIAGQNIKRRDWGIAYVDNVSYGTSVFLPTKSDKRYLKQVRDFDFKTPKYDIAEVKGDEE